MILQKTFYLSSGSGNGKGLLPGEKGPAASRAPGGRPGCASGEFHEFAQGAPQADRIGVFGEIAHAQDELGGDAGGMAGGDPVPALLFLQVLGHGVNRDAALAGHQGQALEPPARLDQVRHAVAGAGDDEPAPSLPGQLLREVDALPAEIGLHELLGLDEVAHEPPLEPGDLHALRRQPVAVLFGVRVAQPEPLDQLPLGVVPVGLDPEIFDGPLFDAPGVLRPPGEVEQPPFQMGGKRRHVLLFDFVGKIAVLCGHPPRDALKGVVLGL